LTGAARALAGAASSNVGLRVPPFVAKL
jgi:hypothetical protein